MIALIIGGIVTIVALAWAALVVAGQDDDRMGRPRG